MTTTLIVLARPGQGSFNASWAQASADASIALGHTVLWSDLDAMGFDPVERPEHYALPRTGFDPLMAQENAAASDDFPPDVQAEITKVRAADLIILHFPIWWFAPPAILKGWTERVLAHGALHDTSQRLDTGRARDKSVAFCVSTGSRAEESGPDGKEGDVRMLLWPLAYTMRYLGMDVMRPQVVHGVHGYNRGDRLVQLQQRLGQTLAGQQALIAGFDALPRLSFNRDDEFDADGRLRADAPQHSAFITPAGRAP
ncbi:NAD(P)H dehydrogenase (quinone) [Monaibacterium marinum]|uniref:NAD(P)H dehydrogenase (Quinone) n=1 Tax=Pontivivens marinum TaxID=1690039 RepID=A0A2C9CR96_9RHOB|nr:NAD(P)H-dependent oxidoreductase [Monaibacterium marinum]SOH94071.1 NAD(P)H dehydrogenase (quinone) [Monaibacterium marinum]